VSLHFTWVRNTEAVEALLPDLEAALAPFDARPHWGKVFTMPPDRLEALYPRLPEFRKLLLSFDPAGKFRNEFMERNVFGR
jgi:xylitol oxidase